MDFSRSLWTSDTNYHVRISTFATTKQYERKGRFLAPFPCFLQIHQLTLVSFFLAKTYPMNIHQQQREARQDIWLVEKPFFVFRHSKRSVSEMTHAIDKFTLNNRQSQMNNFFLHWHGESNALVQQRSPGFRFSTTGELNDSKTEIKQTYDDRAV